MGIFANRGAKLLAKAGVEVNGRRSWDPQMTDPDALFRKAFFGGSLAFCESYMAGEWDCDDLFGMLSRIFESGIDHEMRGLSDLFVWLRGVAIKVQTVTRSLVVARQHYDLGNDFYAKWLDPSMTYSCARWKGVNNLADAQLQKRRELARKLDLRPGMRTLDIGCGWGALAQTLAEENGALVTGLTLSKEQQRGARERCKRLPVEILWQDYRHHDERHDRIVSVGMLEHVGVRFYDKYFRTAYRCLEDEGLFVCHAIVGRPNAKGAFLDKYIFHGGELGATWQVQRAAERAGFKVEDWENFGHDYYLTLMAWYENFVKNWEAIAPLVPAWAIKLFGSREGFKRGFTLYLIASAALFYTRKTDVGQWVFSKNRKGVYQTSRL